MKTKSYLGASIFFITLFVIPSVSIGLAHTGSLEKIQNQSNYANITIDGNLSDWTGIIPSIDNSNEPIDLAREVRSVYLANNDTFIFLRLNLCYKHFNSGNYFTNITLQNTNETVFFITDFYSTLSYNVPNQMYVGFAVDFTSDLISFEPWILNSNNYSAGSISPFNSTIDIVSLEIELPINLLNITNDFQIKFWDVNYPLYNGGNSLEAGLVSYTLSKMIPTETETTTTTTINPATTNSDTNPLSNGSNNSTDQTIITTADFNFAFTFVLLIFVQIIVVIRKDRRN